MMNMQLEKILNIGKNLGADDLEIFYSDSEYRMLRIEKNFVYPLTTRIKAISFRATKNRNIGLSITTDLNEKSIKQAIKTAVKNAEIKGPDPNYAGLPEGSEIDSIFENESVRKTSFQEILDVYNDILSRVKDEKKIFLGGGSAILINANYRILNSNGANSTIKFDSMAYLFVTLTKEFPPMLIVIPIVLKDKVDPDKISEKIIEKTLEVYGAKEINYSGAPDIIFSPYALSLIFSIFNQQITASAIDAGRSPYTINDIGKSIANEQLTIIDDPQSNNAPFKVLVDMEGVKTCRKEIISKGKLKTILTDHYYANKLSLEKTGNMLRMSTWSIQDPVFVSPQIMPWFWEFEGKNETIEKIIEDTKEGFIITDVMGVHQSDISSGKFSVPAVGIYIKNGEIRYPVRNIMLSGYLSDILKNSQIMSKERENLFLGMFPYLKTRGIYVSATKSRITNRIVYKLISLIIKTGIIKF